MRRRVLLSSTDFLEGGAGHFLLHRHVLRLKQEGWEAVLLAVDRPEHRKSSFFLPSDFLRISVAAWDRWYWPRARRFLGFLGAIRRMLVQRELVRLGTRLKPDFVLHSLDVASGLYASRIAEALGVPLGVIVYDLREIWADDEDHRKRLWEDSRNLMSKAGHLWFVSQELLETYVARIPEIDRRKCSVLLPIPGAIDVRAEGWREEFANSTTVLFAGSLKSVETDVFRMVASAMRKSAGKLVIMTQERRWEKLRAGLKGFEENVEIEPILPTPEEGLPVIAKKATVVLVHYSFVQGAEELGMTSFPSKFIEYTHLGLPVLVAAPADTAVGRWAKEANWPLRLDSLDDDAMVSMLERLKDRAFWEQCVSRCREVAQGEFDPDAIHQRFSHELVALMEGSRK